MEYIQPKKKKKDYSDVPEMVLTVLLTILFAVWQITLKKDYDLGIPFLILGGAWVTMFILDYCISKQTSPIARKITRSAKRIVQLIGLAATIALFVVVAYYVASQ